MALTVSSTHGFSSAGETSGNALHSPPPHSGLTESPLPLFKLFSEDILVNIFSKLEEDPRHLARLACVCRIFAHVVRNECWKRQCTRIFPEIVPFPNMHLDQIPEPPGGWGALMKLLVCCPGLKHAGIGTQCWDLGLDREIGPVDPYNIHPRYVPKRRLAADNGQGLGSGELTTAATGDASVSGTGSREQLIAATGDSPVQNYTLSIRESSVQSRTISVGSNLKRGIGSGQLVEKSAVTVENGMGNGDGQSFQKDSSATKDVFVQGTGSTEQFASNGDPYVDALREVGGQEQEKSVALKEESSMSLFAKNTQAVVDVVGQGTLSVESKAAFAPGDRIVQSGMELRNAPVAVNQIFPTGCVHVLPLTTEKTGGSAAIDPSSAVEVPWGNGRPPRGKPVKRVRWKEEEVASKGEKVVGSKFGVSGEHVKDRDRGRSRKRKERALRVLLAKIPEDPKQRLHIVPAKWTLPREEGSRLLASRFRCDSLYICDWPGCIHPGEKRNYKLFRGFFKNFKTSLLWRNLKDMNARKINIACAFCSATSTWDMMTGFCLRRSFEYHDDGEPVVHACVCENGHVSGAWTDRPGVLAAH